MIFPVPDAALNEHIAFLGKTRSGKSTGMRGLAERQLKKKLPVCIVDPKGDWWGIKLAADGKHAGFPLVIFGGEHADVPIDHRAGAAVAELFATGNRPCLIDMGAFTVGERTRFWIDFASTLFKLTRGDRWLFIDEVHNFAPKGKIFDVDAGKALHWTNRLASEGLGKGLRMVVASQRPQKVHNDTLSSCETLVAMKVLHTSDREAVAEWLKGCGRPDLSKTILETLSQLKRGEGWIWSPENNFGPERLSFPMFSTYDSFKPQTDAGVKSLKGWAEVNLEDVKKKLATFVEEAKAKDPTELRKALAERDRRIAELEKAAKVPTSLLPDKKALEAEYKRGHRDGVEATTAAWGQSIARISKAYASVGAFFEAEGQGSVKFQAPDRRNPSEGRSPPPAAHVPPKASPPSPPRREAGGNGTLGKAGRLILTALAQFGDIPVDRVAAIAGYSANGGGFRNALGGLRTAGYVDGLRITEDGLAALGPYDPLPTGHELLRYWLGRVGKAERSILEAAAQGISDPASVAEHGGYEASGGGWRNALGRLRTLGLISTRGAIELHEDLR